MADISRNIQFTTNSTYKIYINIEQKIYRVLIIYNTELKTI